MIIYWLLALILMAVGAYLYQDDDDRNTPTGWA